MAASQTSPATAYRLARPTSCWTSSIRNAPLCPQWLVGAVIGNKGSTPDSPQRITLDWNLTRARALAKHTQQKAQGDWVNL
jgi:hypothetical protein